MKLKHLKQDINRIKAGGGVTGYEVSVTIGVVVNANNANEAKRTVLDDDIPELLRLTVENNQYPARIVSVRGKRL